MGFIAEMLEKRASVGASYHPARLDDPRVMFGTGYADDATGLHLSEQEVIGAPAVLQALRVLSWSVGMLPCHLYEKTGDGAKKLKPADEHPVHWLLHDEPHPEFTPFEFFATVVFNACFRGNFYGLIARERNDDVRIVQPLDTHRMVKVNRAGGVLQYHYAEESGGVRVFPAEKILHIRGFGDGGILGYALNLLSATAMAKGVAMERFGAKVFKNGMNAAAVVEAEQPIKWANDDEKKQFFQRIKDSLSGEDNWHTVIGLPYGMKMKTLGISAKEAQLIEGMTFQVQEIARLTGVPPSLLMDLSRATFTNSEQQMLQFVQLCVGQWIVNIEQRLKKSLLTPDERKRYVIKFLVDALLRTDLKTQNDALRVALGQPWMSVNEVRDLKELPPVEGGDEVPKPLNMMNPGGDPGLEPDAPAPAAPPQATPPQDGDADTRAVRGCQCRYCRDTAPAYRNAGKSGHITAERYREVRAGAKTRQSLRAAFRKTITRDAGRMVKAEIREVRAQMKKAGIVFEPDGRYAGVAITRDAATDLSKALAAWFEDEFPGVMARTLEPTLRDYAEEMASAASFEANSKVADVEDFTNAYLESFQARTAGSHYGQLAKILRETDPADVAKALDQRMTEWDEGAEDGERMSQGQKIGDRESVQLGAAVARAAWSIVGVSALIWLTSSEACPICEELDGKVVGIDEVFVEASDTIDPNDDEVPPLKSRGPVNNPPLHGGCECDIAPG